MSATLPLTPYVLATPRVQVALGLAARAGEAARAADRARIAPENIVDPMRVASSPLVDGIQRLDVAVFGPRAMPIPRWALYDCAALPGAVIGLGAEAGALPSAAKEALGLAAAAEGLAPLSMMLAIPMIGEGRWLVYTLGSIAAAAAVPDLDARTLRLGLDLLRAAGPSRAEPQDRSAPREILTIAQWSSAELSTLATLSPVRARAAWLPAHDHAATAVFEVDLDRAGPGEPIDEATLTSIDLEDAHALRRLQGDIESGHDVRLAGLPCFQGPSRRIPISRSPAPVPRAEALDGAATASSAPRTIALRPANERLLRDLVPFVVATPEHQARLDLAPFGLTIPRAARFDPLRVESAPFLALLSRLDALTFGPEGMPMPRWLFLDGSALPGGIVGLARDAASLDPEARALFRLSEDYAGLVPLAMYIAVPTLDRDVWVGHNLASSAEQLPGRGLEGLGRLTKALGLAVYGARAQIGATQWASRALHVHARLGPLELLSAWTPAHADIETLTYRATIDRATLLHLAGDPSGHIERPAPDLWIDSADPSAMQALQARIEAGQRFQIVGPPEPLGDHHQRVPVRGT